MAVNSSYFDHHFPINGRYPTAVDVISLYGSRTTVAATVNERTALPAQATATSPAEKVITPFKSLDSYVNSDGESTITFSDVTYYNGDVSIYKYSGSNLETYLSDLDDRVTGYCNSVYFARVQMKYRLESETSKNKYAVCHFGADCSTERQPSRYFLTYLNGKNHVDKDIASALPKNAHNSIEFDPSTMGLSNGSKSDWDIEF